MKLRIPKYYKEFSCVAGACKDSCCVGWEIDLDEDTYDYYAGIEGKFGDRLRSSITKDEEKSFILNGERCPFLNQKNLCDIYIELGETALCETCTEYPRMTLEYGNVREKCLGLSCDAACQLIFHTEEPFSYEEFEIPDGYTFEDGKEGFWSMDPVEVEWISFLEKARDMALWILQQRELPLEDRISWYLKFTEEVQVSIDEQEFDEMDELIENYKTFELIKDISTTEERKNAFDRRMALYSKLEVLGEEWRETKKRIRNLFGEKNCSSEEYEKNLKELKKYLKEENREYELEQFMCYMTFRYFLKAYYDEDLIGKAKLAAVGYLVIRDMNAEVYIRNNQVFTKENQMDTGRIYSKEVEHSEDNLAFLAEEFKTNPDFTTEEFIKQIRI